MQSARGAEEPSSSVEKRYHKKMQGYPHFLYFALFRFFFLFFFSPFLFFIQPNRSADREGAAGGRGEGQSERVGNERPEEAEKGEKKSLVIAG